ncbi:hypothetical protein CYD26_20220 [Pseudomonas sp. FFUP_PS_473]|jgi:hypothetical protein|uniref:hypothetical protein n=1 Tax=unclassified Pseudomonas TaxID=196821 RepID=UPI000C7CA996|nr:hypothetical protein [Pseudomonas sp. FFUP_PS_473]MEE3635348.1 hypothetical protein [Pseudomonas sp. AL 58]PLP88014.1 hypothetical protein CYD26_20220 [Pseudomonas sp. FFUP_PS_473]WJM94770.1 hypothetical protein QEP73_14345 [Pseudomonas defluvii]
MLGYYAQYSKEYIATLMIVTTLFFALPIFIAPIAWAKAMRWTIPDHQHLAIYFGRCLGAFILVIEAAMLRSVMTGTSYSYAFDLLFMVFGLMFAVHVYGALKRIQPITETLEIGFWVMLFVLNILFYPATTLTP